MASISQQIKRIKMDKFQAPFNYVEAMSKSFSPKSQTLNEDFHSDGTKKSTGNAFDLNRKKEDKPVDHKKHDVQKVSTGTRYTRKSDTFDKHDSPEDKGFKPEEKRGRGRPPGKYGSYKKKISEALTSHSVVSEEQLDELSKKTLGSYINKATRNAKRNEYEAGELTGKDPLGNSKEFHKKLDTSVKRSLGIKKAVSRLTKEDLEEFIENFEQLDELSKKTLGSYVNKATTDVMSQGAAAGISAAKADGNSQKLFDKALKRKAGVAKAVTRLTKEDLDEMTQEDFDDLLENFEQLDELSKKTLGSYVKKATKDISKSEKSIEKADSKYKDLSGRIGMAGERRRMLAQSGKGSGRIQSSAEVRLRGKQDEVNREKYKAQVNINKRNKGIAKASERLTKEDFSEGDKVTVAGKVGIVEHIIGQKVLVLLDEGIRTFNIENVSLAKEKVTDMTLLEGVSWDRWDSVHESKEKESLGTWMVSLNESGYRYGQVEGTDYIKVKGNGLDAAEAAQKLAQEHGKTAYILEAFTPDEDNSTLSFTNIVKSAFSV